MTARTAPEPHSLAAMTAACSSASSTFPMRAVAKCRPATHRAHVNQTSKATQRCRRVSSARKFTKRDSQAFAIFAEDRSNYRLVAAGEGIVRRPFTIGGSPFTSKKVSVM